MALPLHKNRFALIFAVAFALMAAGAALFWSSPGTPTQASETERFERDKVAAGDEAMTLSRRLRDGKFDEVYAGTASCMKQTHSRDEFVKLVAEITEAMREYDPAIEFRHEAVLDGPLPYSYTLSKGFFIGERPGSRQLVNTEWQNEDGVMRLAGIFVFKSAGDKSWIFGTSSCKTTKVEKLPDGETRTTVVIDRRDNKEEEKHPSVALNLH